MFAKRISHVFSTDGEDVENSAGKKKKKKKKKKGGEFVLAIDVGIFSSAAWFEFLLLHQWIHRQPLMAHRWHKKTYWHLFDPRRFVS